MSRFLQAAAFVALSALSAAPVMAADYTLKVSSPTNSDVILKWMEGFKKGVEAKTDGAIEVQLFPANQLGQIPATVEGVAMGTIEVTAPASSFFVQYDKKFEVLDVPGLFGDLAEAQKVLADPDVEDHLSAYAADQGMETIAAFPHGPLGILSVKPIDTIAALKGQKIRVAGPSALATGPLEALGASPISMPLGEVLPAMQNGVVDGLIAGLPVFTTGHYYDVAKGLTVLPESYMVVTAVASQSFLDMIGPELADDVRAAAREALTEANTWNLDAVEQVKSIWEKNGGKILTLSPEDQKAYLDAVAGIMPKAEADNPDLADEITFMQDAVKRLSAQ
ncbi:TRAP transporter substrate-binding protein [uncultured Martelella sp.]|uniref:TRAP transporter substrate-binding protein n=1 Tax=uncultured Martelella sp. TaxID=392331 RepID=UPI0029C83BB2|nr:TRAP transporter substrate-binding protein [uncultured Martelella sp.]